MLAEKVKAAFRRTLCRTYDLRRQDDVGKCDSCDNPEQCEILADEALTYRQVMLTPLVER